MNAIQNATKHFKTKLANGLEWVDVPEWDTKVYFTPSATLKQTEEVVKLHQDKKVMEALVTVLIMRALNEEGKPLFKMVDKFELMNSVDPEVVIRVANHILNQEPKADEIAKN